MITINRDEMIKEKGKLDILFDIDKIIHSIDIDKVINIIAELYLLLIESEMNSSNE